MRLGCRSGVCLLMGVKVAGVVGDGVAVGVRPDVVRGVVAHGVRLLRSWRGCARLTGLKRSARVVSVACLLMA